MHPLFSAAVSRPGLVLEHASAYAELASVELEEAIARHRSHFVLVVVMWLLVCLAFALLSVSFMFHVAMNDTLAQSHPGGCSSRCSRGPRGQLRCQEAQRGEVTPQAH